MPPQPLVLVGQRQGQALELFGDGTGTEKQTRQLGEELADLTQRKAVGHAQDRRGSQGIETQLGVGQIGGGRLVGVPGFHSWGHCGQ